MYFSLFVLLSFFIATMFVLYGYMEIWLNFFPFKWNTRNKKINVYSAQRAALSRNEEKTIKIKIKKNPRINLFYSNVVSLGTKRIDCLLFFRAQYLEPKMNKSSDVNAFHAAPASWKQRTSKHQIRLCFFIIVFSFSVLFFLAVHDLDVGFFLLCLRTTKAVACFSIFFMFARV